MPTIANRGSYRYELPADSPEATLDGAQSPRLRIRVAKQRTSLTRSLANGADPTALPELALRASQLTSRRSRKVLARTLRNVLGEARTPSRLRSRVVLVRRAPVLEARSELAAVIGRLADSRPVRAEGVAIVEQLITDAAGSPLYNGSEPDAVRRVARAALVALEPGGGDSHEFSLAQ